MSKTNYVQNLLFSILILIYFLVLQGVFFKFIYLILALGFGAYLLFSPILKAKNNVEKPTTAISYIVLGLVQISLVFSYIAVVLPGNDWIKYVLYALTFVNFGLYFAPIQRKDLVFLLMNSFLLAMTIYR